MRLLLDTNALIWALGDLKLLSRAARAAITDTRNWVVVSAVSAWEIEIKRSRSELEVPQDLVEALAATDFRPLPVTIEHGIAAGRLPLHHRDPFDRMLVAQAQLDGLTIVTRDRQIARYQVAILPA